MTQFNPTGLLDGAAGQAIAQSLQSRMPITPEQQALLAQKQQEQLGNELPNMMQAMATNRQTDAAVATSQQALQDAQTSAKNKQEALDRLRTMVGSSTPQLDADGKPMAGVSNAGNQESQLALAQALSGNMDNANSGFTSAFKKQEAEKHANTIAAWQSDIIKHGVKDAVGTVTLLGQHSKEDLAALSQATGNDPKVMADTLKSMTDLVARGKLDTVQPILDKVVDTYEQMYNNPNTKVLATHDKLAQQTMSSIIGQSVQKWMHENPNSGMSPQEVSVLVHQALPAGLASLKSIVDLHHSAIQAYSESAAVGQADRQLDISQQNANTGVVNAKTAAYSANAGQTVADQKEIAGMKSAALRPIIKPSGTTKVKTIEYDKDGMPQSVEKEVQTFQVVDPTTGQITSTFTSADIPAAGGTPAPATEPAASGAVTPDSPKGKAAIAKGYKYHNGVWSK